MLSIGSPSAYAQPDADAGPAPLPPEQLAQLRKQDELFSIAFAKIVSLMIRAASHNHLSLADLTTRILPAMQLGQFAILDGEVPGVPLPVPVACALWASVSPEIDQRMSNAEHQVYRLLPDDWRSGDVLWLTDVIGDKTSIPLLLQRLNTDVFEQRPVKIPLRANPVEFKA